jgi:hypothetical protein
VSAERRQHVLRFVLGLLSGRVLRLERLVALVAELQEGLDELLPEARPFRRLGADQAFRVAGAEQPQVWARVVALGRQIDAALDGLGLDEAGRQERHAVARLKRVQHVLGLGRAP